MKRFGLIGKNIEYSFSRGYFAEKFRKLGLDSYTYENFDLQSIGEFSKVLPTNPDLAGLNVTIPYKQEVIPFLDQLHPEAEAIGAVNTIAFNQGKTMGYNTDIIGFRESLKPLLRPTDRAALVLGSGGASKAVCHALESLDIYWKMVSRKPASDQFGYEDLNEAVLAEYQILINCTPLGTHPRTEAAPELPYESLNSDHLLYDLVYNPPLTRFLKLGLQQGARIKNGREMLELQAEASWEIWNS